MSNGDKAVADFFGDEKKEVVVEAGGIPSSDENKKEAENPVTAEVVIIKCKRCGKPLSNKYNVKRGLGDTCAAKIRKGE